MDVNGDWTLHIINQARAYPHHVAVEPDYREVCILDLVHENEGLRHLTDQLIDVLADVVVENARLRTLYGREFLSRFHGDITIARQQRQLHRRTP